MGKRVHTKTWTDDHIACPHCGGELNIQAKVAKSKRRGVNRGPKI